MSQNSEQKPGRNSKPYRAEQGVKHKGADKVARIPVKVEQRTERLRKPSWIRASSPFHPNVKKLKAVLREQKLHTVCEEAACPNLGECFGKGTATFMIMGDPLTQVRIREIKDIYLPTVMRQ